MIVRVSRAAAVLASVSLALGCCTLVVQAAPQPSGKKSLEDLGENLLDDNMLEQLIKSASKAKPSGAAPADSQPGLLPDTDELRRRLAPQRPLQPGGEDLGQTGESPLARISSQMAEAGDLIAERETSGRTRDVQEEIISELDKLIDELNKQCQQCSSGKCDKPGNQQTQKSTPKPGASKPSATRGSQSAPQESQVLSGGGGEAQPGSVADRDVIKQLWGQLPERLRQQLLQSTADEFLPKYREELELYFRRLAEEQPGSGQTP